MDDNGFLFLNSSGGKTSIPSAAIFEELAEASNLESASSNTARSVKNNSLNDKHIVPSYLRYHNYYSTSQEMLVHKDVAGQFTGPCGIIDDGPQPTNCNNLL